MQLAYFVMRQSSFPEQELRIETERCVQYGGTARVRLEVLHFHDQRQLSRTSVDRLKNVFEIDEVRRLEPGITFLPSSIGSTLTSRYEPQTSKPDVC